MADDRVWLGEILEILTVDVLVKEDDGVFLVRENTDAFWDDPSVYKIEADRLCCPDRLLACICHMSDKSWFTSEHGRQLSWTADGYHGGGLVADIW